MIKIPIQPGFVAAFVFIVFDIVSIALVDFVLSKLANAAYYRQIFRGKPIQAKSIDVSGISTFLIHRFLTPINFIILLFKLTIVGIVFYLNLNIDSTIERKAYCETRPSTFDFDPSYENLVVPDRNISRRPEFVSSCRKFDPSKSGTISYYRTVFNITYSPVTTYERLYNYEIVDTTLRCLSPDFVTNDTVQHLVTVTGCSNLTSSSNEQSGCSCSQTIERPFSGDNVFLIGDRQITFEAGSSNVTLDYFRIDDDSINILWPEYYPAVVYCTSLQMGRVGVDRQRYRTCMIVMQRPHQTLVELWKLEFTSRTTGKFIRNCPGPVFDQSLDVSVFSGIFSMLRPVNTPWEVLSKEIVGASAKYREKSYQVCPYGKGYVLSTVPTAAVIVGGVLFGLSFVAVIIVIIAFRNDECPRLNTIDGISSIIREETAPTKRSLVAGAPALLGWSIAKGGPRFGPLLTPRQAVPRSVAQLGVP